jgi:hypothetical protein
MSKPTKPNTGCALLVFVTIGLWAVVLFMIVLTTKLLIYE